MTRHREAGRTGAASPEPGLGAFRIVHVGVVVDCVRGSPVPVACAPTMTDIRSHALWRSKSTYAHN